jgi:uncharacterized membrane protein YqaE (UPF0057 family)
MGSGPLGVWWLNLRLSWDGKQSGGAIGRSEGGGATARGSISIMDFIRILLAIILPPLGVFLQVGLGKHFWINILLTLLGYIPGIVHAVYIIAKVGPKDRPAAAA